MSYRFIVFEGNELVGKSTIKKQFELNTNFKHLCVDRMYITSIIYDKYKGRHTELIPQLYKDLDRFIRDYNPLFVIVTAKLEDQLTRFNERGEDYIKKEELADLNKLYSDFFSEMYKIYPYNFIYVVNNNENDVKNVVELIKLHV